MDTADIVSFANNRQAALLIVVIGLGILLACAWSLLRPWPPGVFASLLFGFAALLCVSAIGYALIDRELRLDFARGEVVLRQSMFGIDRIRRWRLEEFQRVAVLHRETERSDGMPGNPNRPRQGRSRHDYYVVELQGAARRLSLDRHDSLLDAEELAFRLARKGRWQAWRSGYAVQVAEREAASLEVPAELNLRAALAMARDATQLPARTDAPETGRELTLRFRRRPAGGEAYGVGVRLRIDPRLEGVMDDRLLPVAQ